MKIYKLIGCLFICINSFGQVDEINDFAVAPNRVEHMAVYPGCEQYRGNKRKLVKCFGGELGKDVLNHLDQEFPDGVNKPFVKVQLEFHVSTNGEITNIIAKKGDDEFKSQAKEALVKVADYLKRTGKKIEPARMADGSRAIIIFHQMVMLKKPDY